MDEDHVGRAARLGTEADRLDELAGTAELMGDEAGAERLHAAAASRRLLAMSQLDQAAPTTDG